MCFGRGRALVLVGALAFVGCSGGDDDETPIIRDGGPVVRDGGEPVRDGGPRDAGEVPPDGGVARDAGLNDGGAPDAGGCGPLETMCGAECVDVFADDDHCGDCGVACTGGTVCLNGACGPPPDTNVVAVPARTIAPGCSPEGATWSKLAIDPSNRLFIGLVCGDTPYVVRSDDLGVSFAAPTEITVPALERFELIAPAPDVLYLAGHTTGRALVFVKSTDGGRTWSAPRVIDAGPITLSLLGVGPHVRAWRNHIFLLTADSDNSEVRVWRSDDFGEGAFAATTIPFTMPIGGSIEVDVVTGELWLFVDGLGRTQIFRSTDSGASYVLQHMPMGFAIGGTYVLAPGQLAYRICGFVGQGVCTARLDLTDGSYEALDPGAGLVAASPFGNSIQAAPNGGAYLGARRVEEVNAGFAITAFSVTGTSPTDVRIVTTSTTVDLDGGLGFSRFSGTTGVATVFTSSVGAASSVELF